MILFSPDLKVRLEQGENNEQSENINTDTDGSTLLSKLENKRYRPPKTACIFDGRLLKLNKKDIHGLEENCSFYVGRGSFGEVYASESKLDGFGLRVAYKKIPHFGPYEKAIRREKIASRIMHPFILPLLAVEDRPKGRQEVWFISSYCENGDLNYAIEIDHDASSRECMKMSNVTRVKILLQIALAIEYIHTSVKNVREAILHKDIASKNIVLDTHYNARLIDFGLAKEKDDETTTNLSGRLPYLTPEMKTGMANATESSDYYSYGVVIREMLTGLKPKLEKPDGGFLSCMDAETILTKLQQNVWPEEAPATARRLNSIAQICLEAEKWDVSVFKTEVVKDLRDILTEYNGKILDIPEDYKRCHICMINPQATESSMRQKHEITCVHEIKVCVACEKNSFLNPITCYCGAKLKPDIGYRWGALLVAGNDEKGAHLVEAMANDVEEMKKVITSRAPRIMGIPEDNVCIVVPEQPKDEAKTEKLVSKVEEKIRYFRTNTDVDTLLIYLSCHGQRKDENGKSGFQFGSASDFMSHDDFERALEELTNINRLIVVLDCCYPPLIKLSKPTIQINSCSSDETALSLHGNGMFTKYLIQGLKAESEKTCLDNCEHCKAYWGKRSDFISLENLFDYVNNHLNGKAPPPDWQQRSWKNIAFFSDEKVEIEFTFNDDDKKKQHVHVPLGYLQNMHELKETLREKFGKDEKVTVSIQKDTFRKDEQFQNCDTLEKVMSAWVHRLPLHVTFGESTNQS